jgi:penicillin-binding protein 1A
LNDWFFKRGGRDKLINWLGLDSKIDSTLAETWARVQDWWNAGSSFFARFRLTGWRKLMNELVCEALTLGAGGFVVLYALALPALNEFDEGKFLTGKFSVKFLDKNGEEIGKRGILHNDSVPLEEIPDHLIKATLATEDRRFFEHFGVDFIGTTRALLANVNAGETVQGGSTLTQQLAKNLFLSFERSIQRKIKEVFLAFLLESRFTKREILKMYFDRAYMGGGAFGVEAAAQLYFGKPVREVNLAEAAMMAGLFKAPTKYSPLVNLPSSRARANDVLSNLVEAGYYSPGQIHTARLHPAKVVERSASNSPDWFLDYAFEEVQRIAEGKNQFVLTARTTIDLAMQRKSDEALTTAIRTNGRSMHFNSGAIVTLETDGAVRALTGGPDYGESQFNRATHARRQPGSSFKVYVYAAALESGKYKPETNVRDSSRSCGNWHPQNYGGGHGSGSSMPLWLGLAKSYNTVAAELSFEVGREKVIEMTQRLGIKGIRKTCSMALGDYGITPLEHTGGIATFANGGKSAKPYAILELVNSKGDLIYSRERDEPEPPQLIKRSVAENMNRMMNKVVTDGTAMAAKLDFTDVAGKTGTSTGPKDVWFVGFTGKYVTTVWIGNDDNRPMAHGNTGGHLAAPVWHSYMSVAHTDMNFPPIPGLAPHPKQLEAQAQSLEQKRESAGAEAGGGAPGAVKKSQSLMPEQTRNTLKALNASMRKAANLPDPAPAASPASAPAAAPAAPAATPAPTEAPRAPAAEPKGRRADAGNGDAATKRTP